MHAKINPITNQVLEFPIWDLRAYLPELSLPEDLTDNSNLPPEYVYVYPTEIPIYNPATFRPDNGTPVFNGTVWTVEYQFIALTQEEQMSAAAMMQKIVIDGAQQYLDTFARTKTYDGILSACTYATSSVPKFRAEGQYCVDARDQVWDALTTLLDEVTAGTKPIPKSFDDVIGILPVLAWPT